MPRMRVRAGSESGLVRQDAQGLAKFLGLNLHREWDCLSCLGSVIWFVKAGHQGAGEIA